MQEKLSADEGELFALAGKVSLEVLAERITELEAKHEELGIDLDEVRRLFEQHRRKQVKEGPLAPLAEALAYHHKMVMGWTRLALEPTDLDEFPVYQELHTQFVRMRDVVTHYEYVAQMLLGINPSPMADLEDDLDISQR